MAGSEDPEAFKKDFTPGNAIRACKKPGEEAAARNPVWRRCKRDMELGKKKKKPHFDALLAPRFPFANQC